MKKNLQAGIKTLFILFVFAFLQLAAYAQPVNGTTTFPGSQNFGSANFDVEGTLDGFIFLVSGRNTVSLSVSGGLLKMLAAPLSGQSFEAGAIGSADNSSFTLKTITFQASSSFSGTTVDVTGWNNTVGEVALQGVAITAANVNQDIVVDVSGNSNFSNISSIEIKPPVGTTIGGTAAISIRSITISAPTTASITATDALNTNAATVDYSVTFVGPVTGLTASNFTLSGTGTNNASVGTPTSSNNITWNVPVTTGDNGTLLLTLANATNLSSNITNIPVNGNNSYHLLAPVPTVQASNITAGSITSGTANLSWARGNGDNCLVFVSNASSGSPAPATGASYNANAAFSSGDQIGTSGWYAVYSGTGTSVQLTGLSPGQTYRAAVVEYGGTPGSGAENYLQSFGTNVTNLTAAALPVLAASPGSTGYTLGGAQLAVDPGITLTSTSAIASATVTIGSSFNTGDQLNFVNQNGITGSYDAGTGVLSLTGGTSAANYQAALQSIAFSTTSTSIATRTVTFKVNDGANDSNTASKDVSIAITISSLTAANALVTNAATVNYTATFATAVTGLTASNFTLSGTGTNNASIGAPTSSDNITWNVPVTTGDDGTLLLTFANATNLSPNVTNTSFNGDNSYTIDKTAPTFTGLEFLASHGSYAKIGDVVTLTFGTSEAIQAPFVTIDGHSVTAVIIDNATNIYSASYTMISSDEEGRIDFNLIATDLAGNSVAADAGDAASIEFDKTPPTVVISAPSVASIGTGTAGTVTYTVTYADANFINTSNLTNAGITLNTTGTATGTVNLTGEVNVTGAGASYTVTISGITGAGTLAITVGAGHASDLAGNTDPGAGPSTPFNVLSNDATLSALGVGQGSLNPTFNSGVTAYADSLGHNVTSITVTPTTNDPGATAVVTINGNIGNTGALNIGDNAVVVTVTAADGITTGTYTIRVGREGSHAAGLANLSVSGASISPSFATATTSYTANVSNKTQSVTLTPSVSDLTSTVTVNGIPVANKTASGPIALNAGSNTITVVVTAQDGATKRSYTVNVIRAGNNDAYLASMSLSSGAALSPAFAFKTLNYTASVPNRVSSVTLTGNVLDPNATFTVNTSPATPKVASTPIQLTAGANTIITIVVKAQDNSTTQTYTVKITRAAGSVDSYAPIAIGTGISVTKPTETPALAEDGILVHQGISPNGDGINDFLQIDNIIQFPDNKLAIMNRNGQLVYEAKGYNNSSKLFDGHSNKNGQMQLPGTYFYQLDYTVSGITKHKTGFIVLKY